MEENNFNMGQHEIQNLMEIQYRIRIQGDQTTWRDMILILPKADYLQFRLSCVWLSIPAVLGSLSFAPTVTYLHHIYFVFSSLV